MKKDPEVFLDHILESIDLIEDYSEGVTESEFIRSDEDEARVAEFEEGVKRGIEQFETGQVKTFDDKGEFLKHLRAL